MKMQYQIAGAPLQPEAESASQSTDISTVLRALSSKSKSKSPGGQSGGQSGKHYFPLVCNQTSGK